MIGLATAAAGEKLADVVMKRWGAVKGTVTDPDGKPLAGVEVKARYPKRPAAGHWPKQPSAKTDAEGRFTIERLLPGRDHTLTVKAPKGLTLDADEVSEFKPTAGETVDAGEIRLSKNSAK